MKGIILGDRYELLEEIGQGGMALVYRAHCRILDRTVAVKILKEEFSHDDVFVHSFKTEAHAAARLSHPNIVNIYDVGQQNDIHYIVMEYVEGQTLQDIIINQAPLSVDRAVNIAIMICDGIQHAHENGIIHRDIKPHNILVTPRGIVKVADFGIAQAISKKTITFGGDIVGSVHYISPEQAKGEPVTPATDIYSLGCLLYEMLTGRPPFDAEGAITIALKHIHDQPVLPQSINPEVPEYVGDIIMKAMEKLPQHRFTSAEEMRNVLLNMDGSENNINKKRRDKKEMTVVMPPISGANNSRSKKKRIHPRGIVIITVAVLGLLSGMFFVLSDNLFGSEVVVPNLQGIEIKEADTQLKELNLERSVTLQFSSDVEVDHVISQEPAAGLKVKEGRQIKIFLSKGPELIKVPNVVGQKLADAQITLRNNDFEVGFTDEQYDSRYEKGEVISQDPVYGKSAEKGRKVNLLISKGEEPKRVAMPKLIGLTLEQARQKLLNNGLELGDSQQKESQQYYKNYVIEQDTDPGVLTDQGSAVNLTVSSGPGPVVSSKAVEFTLPREQEFYDVELMLTDDRGEQQVYNELRKGGETVSVMVAYYGKGTVQIILNGTPWRTMGLTVGL